MYLNASSEWGNSRQTIFFPDGLKVVFTWRSGGLGNIPEYTKTYREITETN
jgi:hypothetical protein